LGFWVSRESTLGLTRVKWIELVLVDTEKEKKPLGSSLSSLLQSSTGHLTPESSRGTGTGTGTGTGAAGAVAILSWKCRYSREREKAKEETQERVTAVKKLSKTYL
jgi:hypothetical protein